MEDDSAVRKLVEVFSAFFTERKDVEEDVTHSLSSEFLSNMENLLIARHSVLAKLQIFSNVFWEKIMSSSEMYLRYVIYASRQISLIDPRVFERFLGALATVLYIIFETQQRIGVNIGKLVPDIFMVYYENELKKKFCKCGGFLRFVKYINHKNLRSYCMERNYFNFDNPNADEIPKELIKAHKIVSEELKQLQRINLMEAETDGQSLALAKKVQKITKIEFLPLSSEFFPLNSDNLKADLTDLLIQKLIQSDAGKRILKKAEEIRDSEETLECRPNFLNSESVTNDESLEQMADMILQTAEKIRDLEEICPSLNSESATNDESLGQMEDKASYEKIIEAVIRHNRSKSSSHGKSKGIQTQADEMLDDLKSTIKSLIEALEE